MKKLFTATKSFRAFGMFGPYGKPDNPARVWIATPLVPGPVFPDSILNIRDAAGNTDQVLAGEAGLQFSL